MEFSQRTVYSLLLAGLALCLFQVWLPAYYLTGDGPCHLYNAQIVHDLWCNRNRELYNRFYSLSYTADPNSMATFGMALLLFVAKGAIAEKLFLTIYVLLYTTGFYLLLKKISKASSYWLLVIFIFVFPLTLAKGFYNFSFSIAFYFWMVWSWLRLLERKSITGAIMFFMFSLLIFFTHLLPFVFGAFTCAALTVSFALAVNETKQATIAYLKKYTVLLLMLLLPFGILMIMFTHKEGGLQLHLAPHPYRLIELLQFKHIINLTESEKWPAMAAGCCLIALFIITAIVSMKNFRINKYDGFAISLLFAGLVYLLFPEDFMGRAIIISLRAQLFVFILIACCIAYRLPEGNIKYAGAFILFICFAVLSEQRISCRQKTDAALNDYLFVGDLIKPGSVVLPLTFSREGIDTRGKMIAGRTAIFHHAADYMGAGQPMILLDNYEANMGYFPVQWKDSVNPYNHLSTGDGIEGMPPVANITAYKQATGISIDYVVMWCYQPSFLQNAAFSAFYKELGNAYHVIYTSPTRRTLLWQKN